MMQSSKMKAISERNIFREHASHTTQVIMGGRKFQKITI